MRFPINCGKIRLVSISRSIKNIVAKLGRCEIMEMDYWELQYYVGCGGNIIYNTAFKGYGYPSYDTLFSLLSYLEPRCIFLIEDNHFIIVVKHKHI